MWPSIHSSWCPDFFKIAFALFQTSDQHGELPKALPRNDERRASWHAVEVLPRVPQPCQTLV